MNPRTARLRQLSLDALPRISPERAVLITEFYQANAGLYSIPVMRAKSFLHLCQHKTVYLGEGDLIVGERGPAPKLVPTFPELTCHSVEDLEILNSRPKTWYRVAPECIQIYRDKIIPYWRGRSMRDRLFARMKQALKPGGLLLLEGYRPERLVANADNYLNVKLKLLPASTINARRDKLSSLIRNMQRAAIIVSFKTLC